MSDKVKEAMKDLNTQKSRTPRSNGNRTNPRDAKVSDAQHGQTDVNKAHREGYPPGATR